MASDFDRHESFRGFPYHKGGHYPRPDDQGGYLPSITAHQKDKAAMASDRINLDYESLHRLLDSSSIAAGLQAGGSLHFTYLPVQIDNPNYNQSTGAIGEDGDDLFDDREQITVLAPNVKLISKEHSEAIIEGNDQIEHFQSHVLDKLTGFDARLHGLDKKAQTIDERIDGLSEWLATQRPPRPSRLLALVWTVLAFGAGALLEAVEPGTVRSFLQLFS